MNYAHKQKKAKLDNWYISSKLGIKLNDWKDTKAGRKRLANDKLDKFLEMTSNKNEWINQEQVKDEAYEWFEKTTLRECYKDFNTNQRNVAKDLGINPSAISIIESGKTDYTKSDVTILLYLYFQDDNNRRYKENKNKKKVGRPKKKIELDFSKNFKVDNEKLKQAVEEGFETPLTEIVEKVANNIPLPTREEFDRVVQECAGLKEKCNTLNDENLRLEEHYRILLKGHNELLQELNRYKYLIDLGMKFDNKE